jgi:hypothetical protein
MNKFAKLFLLAVLTAGLLASTSVLAQDAQGRPPVKPPVVRLTHLPPAAVKHVGGGTYVNTGTYAASIPAATFTAIDAPITVTCPGTTGTCLLQADQWIQTGAGSTSANEFAICFYVDGVAVNGCYYNGSTPADSTFVMGTVSQGKTVPHGNHTVQTFLYSQQGAFMNFYNFTYKIFKP